jgi:hypothetical protein
MIDPKEFWEKKILAWEEGRYSLDKGTSSSALEAVANKGSNSLRFRMQKSREILSCFVSGKDVIEIGCGRGLLAPGLLDAGAKSYLGIDIADTAVLAARDMHKDIVGAGRAEFLQASVGSLPRRNGDVIFSLGLVDWLSSRELTELFQWSPDAEHFHAISEARFSVTQVLHRLYVYVAYGHRTKGYVPRYYTVAEIVKLMECLYSPERYVYRSPRLTFGAFISTLPIGDEIQ